MKNIAILGSTGSIGKNALEVIRHFPDKFRAVALSANSNIEALSGQIKEFHPLYVCVGDTLAAKKLKTQITTGSQIFSGQDGLLNLLRQDNIDQVLLAISGGAALEPLLEAVTLGKEIALANKEALVMAGCLIMRQAAKFKVKIIPIDSEQSAIWQCLTGQRHSELKNIYLTASGGPFREMSMRSLSRVSIAQVLKHPRWKMGKKVTVDSANLMNKGLELLEAMFLFSLSADKIKVLIHPQAIIHSMVEFIDGVVLAQLSATDMRIPIQYALSYPQRFSNSLPIIDFYKLKSLDFAPPDLRRFPCLGLAIRAAKELGTLPAVMNAANEICVEAFLNQRLKFSLIPKVIEKVMDRHTNLINPSLREILEADHWARSEANAALKN